MSHSLCPKKQIGCILKGSMFFTCELAKRITSPVEIDFMSVSSYGAGTSSSGVVKIGKDLDTTIEGKNVLVIEDIIDSGRTLSYLLDVLKRRNPNSVKLCTLLDKPDRRVVEGVDVDYCCFNIPDEFVVGYGIHQASPRAAAPLIVVKCSNAPIEALDTVMPRKEDYYRIIK